ncbi:MAG: UDP-diphosphatase [Anaerolineae bacterium]|nr:UDP-diphosphatase [Anaerolineae bacterium]
MSILEALFLGVLQGATEFLPISSSGHLLLVPDLFNMTEPDLNLISIAHVGTLLAVLIYFRQDIWAIAAAIWQGVRERQLMGTTEARLGWFILAGSIPAAAIGIPFADKFDTWVTPVAAAVALYFTALFMVLGEQWLSGRKTLSSMGWADALWIGVAQMVALMPGISRSGATITAGLWRGLDRGTAARYSFLLGIPAIAGAGLLAVVDLVQAENWTAQLPALFATFAAAAVTGYLCIHFLLSWLKRRSLYLFVGYCVFFATVYLLVTLL